MLDVSALFFLFLRDLFPPCFQMKLKFLNISYMLNGIPLFPIILNGIICCTRFHLKRSQMGPAFAASFP
jgi:hypothetical protein